MPCMGKAEPAATSFVLCPGTGRKKAGIYPASVIISGFLRGIRHAADFGPGFPDHLPQNTTVKPAAGRFIRYTQHIAGQPTGQDMLNTLTDQIHFHRRKTCSPVHDGIEHHGQVFVIFIEPAGVIAFLHDRESGASGGSATSDRWWSAPHGYAAHLLPPGNRCFVPHRAPHQEQP
ncbi:hypothetical protein ECZU20_51780 [Escherichia coli]|nr:hypothetical protein ECZU20_51780 [Escherichia coli]